MSMDVVHVGNTKVVDRIGMVQVLSTTVVVEGGVSITLYEVECAECKHSGDWCSWCAGEGTLLMDLEEIQEYDWR